MTVYEARERLTQNWDKLKLARLQKMEEKLGRPLMGYEISKFFGGYTDQKMEASGDFEQQPKYRQF